MTSPQRIRVAPADAVPPAYQQAIASALIDNSVIQSLAAETGYAHVWVDQNGRVAVGITLDGTLVGKFSLSAGSVTRQSLDTTLAGILPGDLPLESGKAQVWVDQANRLALWLTTAGEVGFGKLDAATLTYLAGALDPAAITPPSRYTDPAGNVRKITSGPDIVGWGDSLTAAGTYLTQVQTLTGRTVRNAGVGGETSRDIVARQGGMPMLLTVAGGSIPTSGGVTVTITSSGTGTAAPLVQGTGTGGAFTGTVAGVPGTLTLSGGVYTFTRTTAGSAVAVPRPAPFYSDFSEARREDLPIYWMGRNNASDPDRIIADTAAAILHQRALSKRYLVLSVTNGAGEGTGTSTHTNITAANLRLMQAHGRRFIDVRRYLIDYGLADAGITPTTQDNADVAADIIPVSLRIDSIHLTTAAYNIVGNLVDARLRELGWV